MPAWAIHRTPYRRAAAEGRIGSHKAHKEHEAAEPAPAQRPSRTGPEISRFADSLCPSWSLCEPLFFGHRRSAATQRAGGGGDPFFSSYAYPSPEGFEAAQQDELEAASVLPEISRGGGPGEAWWRGLSRVRRAPPPPFGWSPSPGNPGRIKGCVTPLERPAGLPGRSGPSGRGRRRPGRRFPGRRARPSRDRAPTWPPRREGRTRPAPRRTSPPPAGRVLESPSGMTRWADSVRQDGP